MTEQQDLSSAIMALWMEQNPEPDNEQLKTKGFTLDAVEYTFWRSKRKRLTTMLSCGAYESAVLQMCMPEGFSWAVDCRDGESEASVFEVEDFGRCAADIPGESAAHALLAAIKKCQGSR